MGHHGGVVLDARVVGGRLARRRGGRLRAGDRSGRVRDRGGRVMMDVRARRLLNLDGAGGDERRRGQPGGRLGGDRSDARRQESGGAGPHNRAGSGSRGATDGRGLSGGARA